MGTFFVVEVSIVIWGGVRQWGTGRRRGRRGGGWGVVYRLAVGGGADVDDALLFQPDPQGQGGVQDGVDEHGGGRVVLGALEAELVVPEEAGGGDEEGGVAQAQAHVGEGVGLLELQRVEVVGDGIVGGVLEVCPGLLVGVFVHERTTGGG